jgi:hypothetical protein
LILEENLDELGIKILNLIGSKCHVFYPFQACQLARSSSRVHEHGCARDVKLDIMQLQPHCFMSQCFSCFEDPKSEKHFHNGNSHVGSMEL